MQFNKYYAGLSPRAGIIKLVDKYNEIVDAINEYMEDCPTIMYNGTECKTEELLWVPPVRIGYPAIGTVMGDWRAREIHCPDFFPYMESEIGLLALYFAKDPQSSWENRDELEPLDIDEMVKRLGLDYKWAWRKTPEGLNSLLYPCRWLDYWIKILDEFRYLIICNNATSFTFSTDKMYRGSIANSWIESRGEQVDDEWVNYYDFWQEYAYTTGNYDADLPLEDHLSTPFYDEYTRDYVRENYNDNYDLLYEIVWERVESNFVKAQEDVEVGSMALNIDSSLERTTYQNDRYVGGSRNTRMELNHQYIMGYNNTRADITFDYSAQVYEHYYYSWNYSPETSTTTYEDVSGSMSIPAMSSTQLDIIGDSYKNDTSAASSGTAWNYVHTADLREPETFSWNLWYYTYDISGSMGTGE